MATSILMRHPQTGIVKKGFYGFSWTNLFSWGFNAFFRGDVLTGLLFVIGNCFTFGIVTLISPFFYNKAYTLKLIKEGYVFAGSETENAIAAQKLGVIQKSSNSQLTLG